MGGREGQGRRGVWLTTALLAVVPVLARAEVGSNVRLVNNIEKATVACALDGAARKLARHECQALFDEFKDTSGRPLRAVLEASGVSAPRYLGAVFFYDAPARLCRSGALAFTQPGSRAILVCGARFVRQVGRSSTHAEAVLIHEALHSLGLGENPPSSDEITERVRARCGQR